MNEIEITITKAISEGNTNFPSLLPYCSNNKKELLKTINNLEPQGFIKVGDSQRSRNVGEYNTIKNVLGEITLTDKGQDYIDNILKQ